MNDIHDIKPPVALDDGSRWLAFLGGALLLVMLVLIVRRLLQRTPEHRALRRLRAEADGLDDRTFAYRLTELLRQALARRTGLAAPTMTTPEILSLLPDTPLPPPLQRAVADVLRRSDLPRYAPPSRASGGEHSPRPPEASSSSASLRHTDLDTVRRLLRRPRRAC